MSSRPDRSERDCSSSSRRRPGTGKTTLVERLVQILPNLRMSRSYTSRPARAGERDGVDYNFISREQFEAHDRRAASSSSGPTCSATLYGTVAARRRAAAGVGPGCGAGDRRAGRAAGQGARHRSHGDLRAAAVVRDARAAAARPQQGQRSGRCSGGSARRAAEAASYVDYDYVVVNDELEPTVVRLQEIIAAERSRMHRMKPVAEDIIKTFRTRTGSEP